MSLLPGLGPRGVLLGLGPRGVAGQGTRTRGLCRLAGSARDGAGPAREYEEEATPVGRWRCQELGFT